MKYDEGFSYLPFRFKSCTEQTWAKVKANAIAILRKNFPKSKFRVYKYYDSMEIMFDGAASKEEVYAKLRYFETKRHCSAGYSYEYWSPWNFDFGGVKYVFIKKKGEDLTYHVLKRNNGKKAKRR